MRLFLAIYPPASYIRYFADVYKHFDKEKRNLKLIPVDHIHVTMRFVGPRVSEGHVNDIISLFKQFEGQYPKPEIGIGRIQFGFARQEDPRHLLATINDNDELSELYKTIHLLLRSLKFKDTIRWKTRFYSDFHITIARLKGGATRSTGKNIREINKSLDLLPPPPFIADEMYFVESIMKANGPVYRKIDSIKL
jgi:2'-5' RNA ligase